MEGYKMRMVEEYQQLKGRLDRLERMLIKYDAGTLDFTPNCNIEILKAQRDAMEEYCYCLEVRAEIEKVDLSAEI